VDESGVRGNGYGDEMRLTQTVGDVAAAIVAGDDHRRIEGGADIDNEAGARERKKELPAAVGANAVEASLHEQGGNAATTTVRAGQCRAKVVGVIPGAIHHRHGRQEEVLFLRHNLKMAEIGQQGRGTPPAPPRLDGHQRVDLVRRQRFRQRGRA
jgi:hypothetical protein